MLSVFISASRVFFPSMNTLPRNSPSLLKGMIPFSNFNNVLLPHPDSPAISTISPAGMNRFTFCRVGECCCGYVNVTFFMAISPTLISFDLYQSVTEPLPDKAAEKSVQTAVYKQQKANIPVGVE